jgi:hypothetical protein
LAVIDPLQVEAWVRAYVEPVGRLELVHERPWAVVLRVPLTHGAAWFKACPPAQAFEPWLTAGLSARWPDRVVEVLGYDEERRWLLLADAGTPVGVFGNPPETWLAALPRYAELQRGEAAYVHQHLAHGVPDLRLATLPAQYDALLRLDLPLQPDEVTRLRQLKQRFAELCHELAAYSVPETIQHDDLHHANLYARGERFCVLDWGDASISHPFASLVVTFRFLEERTGLAPGDPWFMRLRDAYLEPWGPHLTDACALAVRVGAVARAIACMRQRAVLTPPERQLFDTDFSTVLRRALSHMLA